MVALKNSSTGANSCPGGASAGSTSRLSLARLTTAQTPSTPRAARRRQTCPGRWSLTPASLAPPARQTVWPATTLGLVRSVFGATSRDKHGAGGVTRSVTGSVTRGSKSVTRPSKSVTRASCACHKVSSGSVSSHSPRVLALVPARGGSKGIPRKNLQLLGGMPLVSHAVAAGRAARCVSRVLCSTDDPDIAAAARAAGAEVPFLRPTHLARDSTEDWAVFK